MPFASFIVGGGEQYYRIDNAKVHTEIASDAETDGTALLMETDFHEDEEQEQEQQQSRFVSRHRILALTRKPVRQLENNMKLQIRKLDNTTFVVKVAEKATVSELKGAVQRKFEAEGAAGSPISWPHVWGNFCLSYRNQKLLDEGVLLHQLGIAESDELYFVRHLSTGKSSCCQRRGLLNALRKRQGLST